MAKNLEDGSVYENATIANGATTSDEIYIGDKTLSMLILPPMTGTSISFEVSMDRINFYPLYDDTKTAVTVTCDATARAFYLDPVKFAGVNSVKIVSSATELAERNIIAIAVKAIESNY